MKERKFNAAWHRVHRMPPNPTRDQRVGWHAEHALACGCRPIPQGLAADVKALNRKKAAAWNS